MIAETFVELLKDPNHWYFEILLMIIFDVVIGMLLWPLAKKWLREHDKTHHAEECDAKR